MKWLALLWLPLLFFGCTSRYSYDVEPKEYSIHRQASDALYYLADDNVSGRGSQTGFYPLTHYYDAYLARLELVRHAKKTIDAQYYIFSNDEASVVFADELIKAAQRGVKVRILVDDLLAKYRDKTMATIAEHKNIGIKLFNPTPYRGTWGWIHMGLNLSKYGRRMHNKMLVVDNSALVLGGRNIENIYFGVSHKDLFIDNDILAIGPLAAEAANKFETYWNFEQSVDIHDIYKGETLTQEEIDKIDFSAFETFKESDYFKDMKTRDLYHYFQNRNIPLIYGRAKLFSDLPTKILIPENNATTHLVTRSGGVRPIEHTLKVVNPYFVPNDNFIKQIKKMRAQGVEISVLTNSLATNDAIPVYSEYSKYHKKLLELGVHLYEVKPNAVKYIFKSHSYSKLKAPKTSLHAKTMIVDGKYFIIGSFNLDPRSRNLNTEVIALIESEALSAYEDKLFSYFTSKENAYTLALEPHVKTPCVATCIPQKSYDVVWESEENNRTYQERNNDADAGFFRRLGANILRYIDLGNNI